MSRLIKQIPAEYKSIAAPAAYVGNPLIEALPKIFTDEEVRQDVHNFPRIAFKAERELPKHERIHCVSALDDLVITLPTLFEVESALSVMLRRGYVPRNPLQRVWRRKVLSIQTEMSSPLEEYQHRSKTVPALMITGVSGNGKTTLAESLLEMYPQTIVHTTYKDEMFHVKQLVWIKVNASFDASLKGLVLSLFGAVDAALGTTYKMQYEKSQVSIDTMVGRWAQVVLTHHLGVLLVDEIQCFLLRGDAEAKLALSLFLKIGNVCGLPIIFSGTYSAVRLFSQVARNARRVCSGGYFDVKLPSSHSDIMWDQGIVPVVWQYQWVKKPAPLTEELKKAIFDVTQGILAVLIALLRAAQVYAIRNEIETVDSNVIRRVYEDQFVLLHPALAALKSKKSKRLEKFEDLLPPKDQLDALLRPSANEHRADLLEKLLALNTKDIAEIASDAGGNVKSSESSSSNAKERHNHESECLKPQEREQLLKRIESNPKMLELLRQAGLLPDEVVP